MGRWGSLGRLGGRLGVSWGLLGGSWGTFGGVLGGLWATFGGVWGPMGAKGAKKGPKPPPGKTPKLLFQAPSATREGKT